MQRIFFPLAALVVLFAASTAQASTVYFDSGSAKVQGDQVTRHKRKVWVPAHRSKGRLVKGHYAWR
jgi:hypothetical protein